MGISEEKEYSTKVSVILVLRDCPPDISYCIDSLVYQTLEEMELLLVGNANDKSVSELMNYYSKISPKVRVCPLPEDWEGQGRRYGLSRAVGEYVLFADEDTALRYRACAQMHSRGAETNSNLVYARNVEILSAHEKAPCPLIEESKPGVAAKDCLLKKAHYRFPCYLWKRDFLMEHPLEEDGPFDSLAYTWRAASFCKTAGVIKEEMSYSLTGSGSSHVTDGISFDKAVRTLIDGCDPSALGVVLQRAGEMTAMAAYRHDEHFDVYLALLRFIAAKWTELGLGELPRDWAPLIQSPERWFAANVFVPAFDRLPDEKEKTNAGKVFGEDTVLHLLDKTDCDCVSKPLIQEAAALSKWDFVEEYCALKALADNGGVVLNRLLEVNGNFRCLRCLDSFFVFETEDRISTLIYGGAAGSPVLHKILATYDNRDFYPDPFYPLAARIKNVLMAEYDVVFDGNEWLYRPGIMLFDPYTFLVRQNVALNLASLPVSEYTDRNPVFEYLFNAGKRNNQELKMLRWKLARAKENEIAQNKRYRALQKKYEKEQKERANLFKTLKMLALSEEKQ
jgi:glycosyltransferase involved in cell wall biosynthesis